MPPALSQQLARCHEETRNWNLRETFPADQKSLRLRYLSSSAFSSAVSSRGVPFSMAITNSVASRIKAAARFSVSASANHPTCSPSVMPYLTTGEELFMDARPFFRLNASRRRSQNKSRQHRRHSRGDSRYEFPRHIEPVAGSRHLAISVQVAGSGFRPLLMLRRF